MPKIDHNDTSINNIKDDEHTDNNINAEQITSNSSNTPIPFTKNDGKAHVLYYRLIQIYNQSVDSVKEAQEFKSTEKHRENNEHLWEKIIENFQHKLNRFSEIDELALFNIDSFSSDAQEVTRQVDEFINNARSKNELILIFRVLIISLFEQWESEEIHTSTQRVDFMLNIMNNPEIFIFRCGLSFRKLITVLRSFLFYKIDLSTDFEHVTNDTLLTYHALAQIANRTSSPSCRRLAIYYSLDILITTARQVNNTLSFNRKGDLDNNQFYTFDEKQMRMIHSLTSNLSAFFLHIYNENHLSQITSSDSNPLEEVAKFVILSIKFSTSEKNLDIPPSPSEEMTGFSNLWFTESASLNKLSGQVWADMFKRYINYIGSTTTGSQALKESFPSLLVDYNQNNMEHLKEYLILAFHYLSALSRGLFIQKKDYDEVSQAFFNSSVSYSLIKDLSGSHPNLNETFLSFSMVLSSACGFWWAFNMAEDLEHALNSYHGTSCAVNLLGALSNFDHSGTVGEKKYNEISQAYIDLAVYLINILPDHSNDHRRIILSLQKLGTQFSESSDFSGDLGKILLRHQSNIVKYVSENRDDRIATVLGIFHTITGYFEYSSYENFTNCDTSEVTISSILKSPLSESNKQELIGLLSEFLKFYLVKYNKINHYPFGSDFSLLSCISTILDKFDESYNDLPRYFITALERFFFKSDDGNDINKDLKHNPFTKHHLLTDGEWDSLSESAVPEFEPPLSDELRNIFSTIQKDILFFRESVHQE
ncbi:MAG: hypothetical protein HQL54_08290 [Magnetococcales bacterium]|nr:hypothetical protein [Magnetococcales bacterium]